MSERRPTSRRMIAVLLCFLLLSGLWAGVCQIATPRVARLARRSAVSTAPRMAGGETAQDRAARIRGIWHSIVSGGFLALAVCGAIWAAFATDSVRRLLVGPKLEVDSPGARANVRAFCLGAAAFLAVTVLARARQDYAVFLQIWRMVLQGLPPWAEGSGNAYGPLFNSLAYLTFAGPLAPKIIFATLWLACVAILCGHALRQSGRPESGLWVLAYFFLGPLFWAEIAVTGHFDILPGAACLAAVYLREKDRDILSGLCIAVGALLKFYPIVILPFLMLDGRRLRVRIALSCLLAIAVGAAVTWQLWGSNALHPFVFATTRPSGILSIFHFLRGRCSPLRLFIESPNLDRWSLPAMALFGSLAFLLAYLVRMPPAPGALVGLLTALTLYKVGHVQFLTGVVLIGAFWYIREAAAGTLSPSVRVAVPVYGLWLQVGRLLYLLSMVQRGPAVLLKELRPGRLYYPWHPIAGLPTFVLALWVIVSIFLWQRRGRGAGNIHTAPAARSDAPVPEDQSAAGG